METNEKNKFTAKKRVTKDQVPTLFLGLSEGVALEQRLQVDSGFEFIDLSGFGKLQGQALKEGNI